MNDRYTRTRRRAGFTIAALLIGTLCTVVGVSATSSTAASRRVTTNATTTPVVSHVFQIVLENEEETSAFPNKGTELDKLAAQGVFLANYYATGHNSLDNYLAMISGQAQFSSTSQDCPDYHDTGGTVDAKGIYHPVTPQDSGCVFPASVKTLADQLGAAKKTWRGYMEDMGKTPTRETTPCGQPEANGAAINPAVGGADSAFVATAADQYATRHNPFVYFHTLINKPATGNSKCTNNVFPFTRFAADVSKSTYAPAFTFITPNLCDDGHDKPCKGPGSEGANPGAGGLVSANAFLAKVVPMIQKSAAYKNHGLILITFDEGADSDTTGCCGEGAFSTGGGKIGAVLLGPGLHAHRSTCAYNHFSELHTYEDLFGLTPAVTHINGSDGKGHLAHAGDAAIVPFTRELTATKSPCA
ncbi:MAG TPA: alkaline phosphatase family protein [Acidimicrobiia bacterium]|jgi:hypothetical protein